MPSKFPIAAALVIATLGCALQSARAEEITLKDGQKIVGTIVGYEKDMFRVETSYGIALVRKDKVASIQVSTPAAAGPAGTPDGTSRPAAKSASPPPAVPSAPPAEPDSEPSAGVRARPAPAPAEARIPAMPRLSAAPPAPPATLKPPAPRALAGGNPLAPLPPPPAPSHPVDAPMPAHLRDHVDNNTYFNDTFQFSMYKPPDWKIIEGVPRETGSGIMAMGTDDEMTLLIVDRQVWSGTPKLTDDQVEAKLRQTYQDYRRISESSIQCDGQPAMRRTFTGILDGAEWHGVAVHTIHGNTVFGMIGLTSAETFQFQESIFNKVIRTFRFTAP